MKKSVFICAVLLTGCGKMQDMLDTGVDGYALRCIEGTRYILMSSDRGLAITPLLNTEGKPQSCKEKNK